MFGKNAPDIPNGTRLQYLPASPARLCVDVDYLGDDRRKQWNCFVIGSLPLNRGDEVIVYPKSWGKFRLEYSGGHQTLRLEKNSEWSLTD